MGKKDKTPKKEEEEEESDDGVEIEVQPFCQVVSFYTLIEFRKNLKRTYSSLCTTVWCCSLLCLRVTNWCCFGFR